VTGLKWFSSFIACCSSRVKLVEPCNLFLNLCDAACSWIHQNPFRLHFRFHWTWIFLSLDRSRMIHYVIKNCWQYHIICFEYLFMIRWRFCDLYCHWHSCGEFIDLILTLVPRWIWISALTSPLDIRSKLTKQLFSFTIPHLTASTYSGDLINLSEAEVGIDLLLRCVANQDDLFLVMIFQFMFDFTFDSPLRLGLTIQSLKFFELRFIWKSRNTRQRPHEKCSTNSI
jgi:hypothetical protein